MIYENEETMEFAQRDTSTNYYLKKFELFFALSVCAPVLKCKMVKVNLLSKNGKLVLGTNFGD
jgi:hypothetical protein